MQTPSSRRTLLLLVALIGLLGLLGSLPGGGAYERGLYRALEQPLLGVAVAAAGAGDRLKDLLARGSVTARVRELEAKVAALELDLAALDDQRQENVRLRALVDLKAQTAGTVRAARVIAREASGHLRSVVIDQGEADGVLKDGAVIAAEGLVGRVVKLGERTAVVQLLTDAAMGLAVSDERTRVQGVLVGSGAGDGRVKYVPNLEDVRAGDRIVASGLDGIFPKGVLVGVVSDARPGADAFQQIRVRPAVAFERLETVLVSVRPDAATTAARPRLAAAREAR